MNKIVFILLIALTSSASFAQSECDSVLRDGVFSSYSNYNYSESRLSLALKVFNSSYEQFMSNENLKAQAIAAGFGAGSGKYNKRSFQEWKSEFSKQVNVDTLNTHIASIHRSTGDKNILRAWSGCMAQRGGLSLIFKYDSSDRAILSMMWYPLSGSVSKEPVIESVAFPNSKILAGEEYTKAGSKIGIKVNRDIYLESTIPGEYVNNGLLVTVNTSLGGASAFLPPRPRVPSFPTPKLDICACVGGGGVKDILFWGPKGETCNGISGWGKYDRYCKTVDEVCGLRGPAGTGIHGVMMWAPRTGGSHVHWPAHGTDNYCMSFANNSFCSCKGRGDKIGGMTIWGPSDEACGGLWYDETYAKSCR